MEKDEPFYFRAGSLYRISFENSFGWTPIYKDRSARQVIGRLYKGGICLYTGSTWCSSIQIIYEDCIGWIATHSKMTVEEIKEKTIL
jgi:hypothetical protein